MAYFALSVLLVGCIVLFTLQIKKNKKLGMKYEQEKEETKEKNKAYLETAVANYETTIETNEIKYQEEIKKLKKENEDIRKNYRNRGEIITHKFLNRLKEELIHESLIELDEMIIMPNIFILDENRNSRQFDHLIILPQGLYIIETKHWKGHIVLGMTKDNCGTKFSFLPKILDSSKEETLVFDKDDSGLIIKNYGNPLSQVSQSARLLSNYINSELGWKVWTNALVFFNYEKKQVVHDWSTNNIVTRVTSQTELNHFFRNEITTKNRKYNATEINEIKVNIESANYI
ncbi:nuclease-related domain-containing protein [Priestia aryabhattai]|uniref:nuclease-related domain-containing protein n=1 Tax=Priestia aryabhattai TaxID=412384 RepID=UPI002E24496A|nr:nuclease-related domain-containing protein [Priestia aryabhattai]